MCPTAKHVLSGRRTSFRNALGGSTFAIEGSHVLLKREGRVLATLLSDSPEEVVVSFPEVRGEALGRVIDYCRVCVSCKDNDCVCIDSTDWPCVALPLHARAQVSADSVCSCD